MDDFQKAMARQAKAAKVREKIQEKAAK